MTDWWPLQGKTDDERRAALQRWRADHITQQLREAGARLLIQDRQPDEITRLLDRYRESLYGSFDAEWVDDCLTSWRKAQWRARRNKCSSKAEPSISSQRPTPASGDSR